jgi:hypothetical protein
MQSFDTFNIKSLDRRLDIDVIFLCQPLNVWVIIALSVDNKKPTKSEVVPLTVGYDLCKGALKGHLILWPKRSLS